jgi:hypothetical protein
MTNGWLSLMHWKIKILHNTQQKWETNIHTLREIRTRATSKFGIDTCYPSLQCVPTNRDESGPVRSGLVHSDSRVMGAAHRPSLIQSSQRISYQYSLNSAQVKNCTAIENFNMFVLNTIMLKKRLHPNRRKLTDCFNYGIFISKTTTNRYTIKE